MIYFSFYCAVVSPCIHFLLNNKKIIVPFSEKMLELKPEDDDELKRKEIDFEEEEVEDTYDKLQEFSSVLIAIFISRYLLKVYNL